ncbi:hypothetical protein FQN55_006651 [Onygenales sp. PD_40]|nr:hypothetical protein FQN55_006651 [Onygenales sp. PD_40]KAK2782604.1 hypothetical protein FQN52_000814 [Onygenales sp. PD_12]
MDGANLPNTLPFSKKPLRARIILSYIFDYIILIVLVAGFFLLDRVEPFHQPFSLDNHSLYYPYADPETVSIPLALALSGGFPLLVIIIYTIVIDGLFSHNKPISASTGRRKLTGKYRFKDRLWELNCGFLGLFLAQAGAFVITGALKNACGKPRPDIIARCKPEGRALGRFELATYDMCTGDKHILKDGFRSFPSGHSSSSFAGLFYLSLYLAGKLHVMDSRGEVWKTFIVMAPTLGAGLIAVTRIMDARHHPFDVISGSLLGVVCGWIAYRQYFPPLSESWRKGRAYPIRSWGTQPVPPSYADRSRAAGSSNDTMAPLQPTPTDPEYQASAAQGDEYTRKPHSARRTSLENGGPSSDPYMRRRPEFDRNYSSSSGDSVGVAFEMQPNYRVGRDHSESTTNLNTSYQPYRPTTESPGPPRSRSPPVGMARPVSPAEPLKNS